MPTQDWRAIGPVTVHRPNGDVSRHGTLAAALTNLGWPLVSRISDVTPPPGSISEFALCGEPRAPVLLDELGLRIPTSRILSEADAIGLEASWRAPWRVNLRLQRLAPIRFRDGPVPGLYSRRGYSNCLRYMRTRQEAAEAGFLEVDEDAIEHGVKVRGRRSAANLPNPWDDYLRGTTRSWKKHRRTQWRG